MKKKRGIISIVLISIIAVIFIIPLVYMVSTSLKSKVGSFAGYYIIDWLPE